MWVKFVDDAVDGDEDGITRGNISASLGPVYKSASRASDVTKFKSTYRHSVDSLRTDVTRK